ncbi:DUF2085 domain-containing protein [Proteinivorax tanatarense]|uniref:DUF2085 domain-containing protein n=1 Tax=Proteinivorax tanatarense TaxID=1260629 RepID=A0AAU7VIL7_9FIRM
MTNSDKRWVKLMNGFDKYWGCHQLPGRSFFYNNYQLPVCSRCTGIIIGELLSFLWFIMGIRFSWLFLLMLMIPMVVDGMLQLTTSYLSSNIKRVSTGILFGIGFMQILLIAIIKLFSLIQSLL